LRELLKADIDYTELSEMMIELAASLQQLSVLTHALPKMKVPTKASAKKTMSDDDALKLFLSSMKL
jgi:hypothetical protein